jgi:hypothetical protein
MSFAFPIVHPVPVPELPEVHEVVRTDSESLWWVQNTRSDWTVIEDCWLNPSIAEADWMPLETQVRHDWLRHHPESPVVGMDLDWRRSGFCMRIQGMPQDVSIAMVEWWEWLETWDPKRSKPVSIQYSLAETHQQHFKVVEQPSWKNRVFPKTLWKQFTTGAHHRQVQFGPEVLTLNRVWIPKFSNAQSSNPESMLQGPCSIQDTPVYPEMAISIDYAPVAAMDATTMRFLAMALGRGVRSRLSQELRENQGLLYTIGATYQGDVIRVEFSASDAVLADVLFHVDAVINGLSVTSISSTEWMTARSQYAKGIYRAVENPAILTRTLSYYSDPIGWHQGVQKRLNHPYPMNQDWTLQPVHWYATGEITWLEGTILESVCLR